MNRPHNRRNTLCTGWVLSVLTAARSRATPSHVSPLEETVLQRSLLTLLIIASAAFGVNAKEVVWDIQEQYGTTANGIHQAIQDAHKHFKSNPNDQLVLEFAKGSFKLEDKSDRRGTIELSRIKPGPKGRLIFRGKGMNKTTLVFADNKHALFGVDVHRVSFIGMHMTRDFHTVSQGSVVAVGKGSVVIDIQEGFPTPGEIFNKHSDRGRYLRRYVGPSESPQIVEEDNEQIAWTTAEKVEGRRWRLETRPPSATPDYKAGDLVGIKSKKGGDAMFGGQAYWFSRGEDFRFEQVKWTQKTRGVFRGGFNKVHVIDCVTDRAPAIKGQTPYLAAPGGGPQIGQPEDPPSTGHLVQGCRFIASGDDAIGWFNASGTIRDNYIADAFCRGILLANCKDIVLINNRLVRCPIQMSESHEFPKGLTVPRDE